MRNEMKAHGQLMIEVGDLDDSPLVTRHPDGEISIRITKGSLHVWLHGTPAGIRDCLASIRVAVNAAEEQAALWAVSA